MPVWLAAAGAALGKIGVSLLMSLITESFAKQLIAHSLQKIADSTENDWDNQLAKSVKEAWGVD